MGKSKTYDEFIKDVENKYGENKFEFISKYINSNTSIKIKCTECQFIWNVLPSNLLNKQKHIECQKCREESRLKKRHLEFVNILKLNGYTYINGTYINEDSKYIVSCSNGHVYTTSYEYFVYAKHRCRGCYKSTANESQRLDINLVKNVLANDGYSLIGNYKNKDTPMDVTCSKGHKWSTTFGNFKHGNRCPKCNGHKSKGEKLISDILLSKNIKYKEQYTFSDCIFESRLKFDFAIFDKGKLIMIIEYDGEQHFKPVDFANKGKRLAEYQFELNKQRDQIKNTYCKENDIPLVRIPYWDFNNIEEILEQVLLK